MVSDMGMSRRIPTRGAGLLSLVCVWGLVGQAQGDVEPTPLSGREIAQRVQDRYQGDDVCSVSEMKLISAHGDQRSREFVVYEKTFTDGKKTLMKFLRPAEIKDTGNLIEEIKGADDRQYLYLPATQKLRRVSSKNQSWVGSDFLYEDLQELELDHYVYETLPRERVDDIDCHVYSMVPTNPDASVYGKQIWWVRMSDYVPVKVEYYKRGGQLLKVGHMSGFRDTNGAVYAWKTVMENREDAHRTELHRRGILVNSGLDDDLVTLRQLETSVDFYDYPPQIWESRNQP